MSLDPEQYIDFDNGDFRAKRPKRHQHRVVSNRDEAERERTRKLNEMTELNAKNQIKKHIESRWGNLNPREKVERLQVYFRWVKDSLKEGFPIIDDGDIKDKTGALKEKSELAVVLKHIPTLISAKENVKPTQNENLISARLTLITRLQNHLNTWKGTSESFRQEMGV